MSGFATLLQPEEAENDDEKDSKLERWVVIQRDTFTNWVNDKLADQEAEVSNLRKDLRDGVILCKLMKVLRKVKSIGKVVVKKDLRYYETMGNIQLALKAIQEDGVRLVNIGAEDIASGNLKLILGMVWQLIRRYQIGSQSKLPPKKMMLSWINAVLHPHRTVNNFTSDWNDGIALHGVIEYCRPGTFPDWFNLSSSDKTSNCQEAIKAGTDILSIPAVIDPENMSSPDLDELSGMTYLSYFMAVDSPGYKATLFWVKFTITPTPVDNFDRDWNNGLVLSELVNALGGHVDTSKLQNNNTDWVKACQTAMEASERELGVKPVITARDMIHEDVDHIGVMAYAAWHKWAGKSITPPPPKPPTPEPVVVPPSPPPSPPPVIVAPPPPPPPPPLPPIVIDEPPPEEPAPPTPIVEEPADLNISVIDNWRIGSTATIKIDTNHVGGHPVSCNGKSPSGVNSSLPVAVVDDGVSHVSFTPDEKGPWSLHFNYKLMPVKGNPYMVNVYDSTQAKIIRDMSEDTHQINKQYSFEVDCLNVGFSKVYVYVIHDGESVESKMTSSGIDRHRVTFLPTEKGDYEVSVYCGGVEVPDSPFTVVSQERIGVHVYGDGLTTALTDKQAEFWVDFNKSISKSLSVKILNPGGEEIPATIKNVSEGVVSVKYMPRVEGDHRIELRCGGTLTSDSPYIVNVRRGMVYLRNLQKIAYLGHKSEFQIDATEMGKGTIEIDSDLPVHNYEKVGERLYEVTIVPLILGEHDLVVKYNSRPIDGCPFMVNVLPESELY